MALTKEEMILEIYKKYGVRFSFDKDEKMLSKIMSGKYTKAEVMNLYEGRKHDKFSKQSLARLTTDEIRRLIYKYKKKSIPSGVSREIVESILLGKLNPDKLSERDLLAFGKFGRSPIAGAVGLYAGWIPKVGKKVREKDLERGKKVARKY
ncbi:MAG: hypothetical protein PHS44_01650 [Candidatus Dojkabacteria bacterium]|jgi:hypothetical protein|nr:hypothetical protein [Candidatus Dojkabacteria bacterium]